MAASLLGWLLHRGRGTRRQHTSPGSTGDPLGAPALPQPGLPSVSGS